MSKPIIVGYDPMTSDRAPINFGLAAARFTGAPLIVASASAAGGGPDPVHQDEDLVVDASEALGRARRELESEGIPVECRELLRTRAPRERSTRRARPRTPACLSSVRPGGGPSAG